MRLLLDLIKNTYSLVQEQWKLLLVAMLVLTYVVGWGIWCEVFDEERVPAKVTAVHFGGDSEPYIDVEYFDKSTVRFKGEGYVVDNFAIGEQVVVKRAVSLFGFERFYAPPVLPNSELNWLERFLRTHSYWFSWLSVFLCFGFGPCAILYEKYKER